MRVFIAAAAVAVGLGVSGSAVAADRAATPAGTVELNNQGVEMAAQARYAEAEEFYRRALAKLAEGAEPRDPRCRALGGTRSPN